MSKIEVRTESIEYDWVLDSLVGFLKGPLWTDPLFAFLDEKSTIFDPEDDGSNDGEYEKVFKEYKNCVSSLLDFHMRELGISASQFEKACEEAEGVLSCKFHHSLFDQIWAANDFPSFKRMMIQVNIDLQLWALEMLAAKFGHVPNLFLPEHTDPQDFMSGEDDFFLREAMRRSVADSQIKPIAKRLTQVKVSIERPPSGVSISADPEQEISNISNREEMMLKDVDPLGLATLDHPFVSHDGSEIGPNVEIKRIDVDDYAIKSLSAKNDALKSVSPSTSARSKRLPVDEMDADEIKHRQEYLRKQRDKLLGLKKEEREKQSARLVELEKSGRRPRTAKFMAIEKANADAEERRDNSKAYMRSLAARIKAEVLDADTSKSGAGDDDDEK